MTPIAFRALAADGQAEHWASEALPCVHEAGNPYYDWILGGREQALAVLGDWMRRTSSEVFVGRAVVVVEGHWRTGGFIALGGDELRHGRRADALAAMETAGPQEGGTLLALARMRLTQELFGPVPAAVRLYRAAGFRVSRSSCRDEAAMTYLRMNLEPNHAWQDSKDDRADGGRTASGSHRQDGR